MAKSDKRLYQVDVTAVAPLTRAGTIVEITSDTVTFRYRRRGSSKYNVAIVPMNRVMCLQGSVGDEEASITTMETTVVESHRDVTFTGKAPNGFGMFESEDGALLVNLETAIVESANDEEGGSSKSKKSSRKGSKVKGKDKKSKTKGKGKGKGKGKKG